MAPLNPCKEKGKLTYTSLLKFTYSLVFWLQKCFSGIENDLTAAYTISTSLSLAFLYSLSIFFKNVLNFKMSPSGGDSYKLQTHNPCITRICIKHITKWRSHV
jgi:hypothetical protein